MARVNPQTALKAMILASNAQRAARLKIQQQKAKRVRYVQRLRRDREVYENYKRRYAVVRSPVKITQKRDLLFLIMFVLALFKDVMDFVVIFLPFITPILTFLISLSIFIIVLVHGSLSQYKQASRFVTRVMLIAIVSLVEAIGFGINFFPLETAVVIVLYWHIRHERRRIRKEQEIAIATQMQQLATERGGTR